MVQTDKQVVAARDDLHAAREMYLSRCPVSRSSNTVTTTP